MPENYTKPWLSIDEQLAKLRQRGMVVSDPAKSRDYLERISGHYLLSGYWFAFRERSELCCALNPAALGKHECSKPGRLPLDQFKPGASFENAVDLYVFDKKLRLLAMDALERIEISLRVDISHHLGERHRFAYLQPDVFTPDSQLQSTRRRGSRRITAGSLRRPHSLRGPKRTLFATTARSTDCPWPSGWHVRSGILVACPGSLVAWRRPTKTRLPSATVSAMDAYLLRGSEA